MPQQRRKRWLQQAVHLKRARERELFDGGAGERQGNRAASAQRIYKFNLRSAAQLEFCPFCAFSVPSRSAFRPSFRPSAFRHRLVAMGSSLSLFSRSSEPSGGFTTSGKAVLVTGCDRGIGFETARRLDSLGFRVVACVLCVNGEGAKELRRQSSANMTVLKMDVTNLEDVERAKQVVKDDLKKAGNVVLWGVVNNAGICNYGNPEIMKWSDVSAIVDVNLKGPLLVTKAFLPQLRRAGGRVVNISSISGSVPLPNFAIYNATKAGLLMYSRTIRYDLESLGVRVSAVMPGGYNTNILSHDRKIVGTQWWDAADDESRSDFGRDYFEKPMQKNEKIRMVENDLSPLIGTIVEALTARDPKPIYKVGPATSLLPAIYTYAPQWAQDWFTMRYLRTEPAK